jgi:hypothetical protein
MVDVLLEQYLEWVTTPGLQAHATCCQCVGKVLLGYGEVTVSQPEEWCSACFKRVVEFVFKGAFRLDGDDLPVPPLGEDDAFFKDMPVTVDFVREVRRLAPERRGAQNLETRMVMTLKDLADSLNVPQSLPGPLRQHWVCWGHVLDFSCGADLFSTSSTVTLDAQVERVLWRKGVKKPVEFQVIVDLCVSFKLHNVVPLHFQQCTGSPCPRCAALLYLLGTRPAL